MVELANISKEGKLVPFDMWNSYISGLKKEVAEHPAISDQKKAISILTQPISDAVKKRIPKEKFGIFFSGGVDSTIIAFLCKRFEGNFICYTVGIEGSKDIEESLKAAKALGFVHKTKIFSINEAENLFKRTAAILKEKTDVVSLGVGGVVLAAIEHAKKDNIKIFFGGLGSEEIFAGYERHVEAQNINDECWTGLSGMWNRDFVRDFRIAESTKVVFLTPFLDKELMLAAMQISGNLKIKDGQKKYILRKTAESLGLPEEFASRPKKAAQYGSNFDKALTKIAKSKGFRFKSEYIEYLKNVKS
ncbi:MAG: asparagine synthase C-terminal domain-containing protein [archaeon]